jgi:hypothetical protein
MSSDTSPDGADTATAALTIQQRGTQATHDLCAALGLGAVSPTHLKYLSLALAEAALAEIAHNPAFADRVRAGYASLPPPRRSGTPKDGDAKDRDAWKVRLTPIGQVDEALLDPYAPPNPFALQRLYGDAQLPLALDRYSLTALKESLALVRERYPGTAPRKLTKPGIIEYIVERLVSADPLR